MTYGFCCVEQTDVEIGADRQCPNDGSLALPPSWGRQTQRWVDGDWLPAIPRPERYVWRPKFTDAPAPKATTTARKPTPSAGDRGTPISLTCGVCGATFEWVVSGGTPKSYCSATCRQRAQRAKKRGQASPPAPAPCRVCNGPIAQPAHGGRKITCSRECTLAWARQRAAMAPSMAARGIACVCGHPDRPHGSGGRCEACRTAFRRAQRRGEGGPRKRWSPPATPCVACREAPRSRSGDSRCDACRMRAYRAGKAVAS